MMNRLIIKQGSMKAGKVVLTGLIALSVIACRLLISQPQLTGVFTFENGDYSVFATMQGTPYVVFEDGSIRGLKPTSEKNIFEFGSAIGVFDTIQGRIQFEKGNEAIILTRGEVNRSGKKMSLKEEEVDFKNREVKLSGTLILPEGNGPFPCLIMTHGSGPELREESRGLAYLFASQGIAAFIYDKRFSQKPKDGKWKAAFSDYAADAIAAAQTLAMNKLIDKGRIGIYGHSQGGWIAPLAASESDLFSFVIISAGNAVTPVEQHLYNGSCIYRQFGMREGVIQEIYEFRLTKYEAGITGNRENFDEALPIAQSKAWFNTTGDGLPTDVFWKSNGYYDAVPALSALKCPVLVIAGELDKYTDTKRNIALFKEIFSKSGNTKVTFKVFPSANHALMETKTGKTFDAEVMELKRFIPGYFDTLTDWTLSVCK